MRIMQQKGFTLIELLMVLVIVGITLLGATMSVNAFTSPRQLKMTAQQLRKMILTAQQQAILMPETLSLQIDKSGCEFAVLAGGQWQKVKTGVLAHTLAFKNGITVQSAKKIIFYNSGDISPFHVVITDGKHTGYELKMNSDGHLNLNKIDNATQQI